MPMYKSSNKISNKIAYKLSSCSVNLPSGYNLKLKDIKRVCNEIYNFLKKKNKFIKLMKKKILKY